MVANAITIMFMWQQISTCEHDMYDLESLPHINKVTGLRKALQDILKDMSASNNGHGDELQGFIQTQFNDQPKHLEFIMLEADILVCVALMVMKNREILSRKQDVDKEKAELAKIVKYFDTKVTSALSVIMIFTMIPKQILDHSDQTTRDEYEKKSKDLLKRYSAKYKSLKIRKYEDDAERNSFQNEWDDLLDSLSNYNKINSANEVVNEKQRALLERFMRKDKNYFDHSCADEYFDRYYR